MSDYENEIADHTTRTAKKKFMHTTKNGESKIIRPLTPQETCAMYHYHKEYASLGIGAIAYYKGLSPRNKSFIDDMTSAIIKAAQQSVSHEGHSEFCDCPECLFDLDSAVNRRS